MERLQHQAELPVYFIVLPIILNQHLEDPKLKSAWLYCVLAFSAIACTHKVAVETKEPITINMNIKIDHEIKVKIDKALDEVISEDSDLF